METARTRQTSRPFQAYGETTDHRLSQNLLRLERRRARHPPEARPCPYTEKDIIQNPAFRWEMEQKSGQPLSPCIEINGTMLPDVSGDEVERYLLENHLTGDKRRAGGRCRPTLPAPTPSTPRWRLAKTRRWRSSRTTEVFPRDQDRRVSRVRKAFLFIGEGFSVASRERRHRSRRRGIFCWFSQRSPTPRRRAGRRACWSANGSRPAPTSCPDITSIYVWQGEAKRKRGSARAAQDPARSCTRRWKRV